MAFVRKNNNGSYVIGIEVDARYWITDLVSEGECDLVLDTLPARYPKLVLGYTSIDSNLCLEGCNWAVTVEEYDTDGNPVTSHMITKIRNETTHWLDAFRDWLENFS